MRPNLGRRSLTARAPLHATILVAMPGDTKKRPRRRIGVVTDDDLMISGKEIASKRHCRLLGDDYDVTLVIFVDSGVEEHWAGQVSVTEADGYRIVKVMTADFATDRNSRMQHYRRLQHLTRICDAYRLDALHVFGSYARVGFVACLAAAARRIAYMVSARGSDLTMDIFTEELASTRIAIERARICVFTNEEARQLARAAFTLPPETFVIPNSFLPEEFEDAPTPNLPSNVRRPMLATCALLKRMAGIDQLLDAFSLLSQETGTLLLAGEFHRREKPYFLKRLENHPRASDIIVTGYLRHSAVLSYIRQADLLVFPSIADGSPNKVIEGMASGVPVIATAVGGIPELITDCREGFLIPHTDPEMIAAVVRNALQHPELAQSCAARAKARALHDLIPNRERRRWLNCYARLLQ